MPWKINPDSGDIQFYEPSTGGGGGGGATNLTFVPGVNNGVVVSDSGTDATILLADATNAGLMTAAEKTKLSGVQAGAEVNVQSDWNAASGDAFIANKPAALPPSGNAGGDLTGTYPDPVVHAVHGVDFQNGTPSDGDVWNYETSNARWKHSALTPANVGLGNVPNTDATLRANHTGTQSADTVIDGTTNKVYTATEKTKLSGIATGATANDTDANLKARANHTGTQTASTISDFNSAALAAAPAETTTTEGALINGATSKTTPVDADSIGLVDSAASNILKKLTWANAKATLKSYFDTLYTSAGSIIPVMQPNETWRGLSYQNNSTTTTNDGGITQSASASVAAVTVSSSDFVARIVRIRYYPSVISTGRYVGVRGSALLWYVSGGFRYVCDFHISDTAYGSGCRQFYGLQGGTADLTYTDTILVASLLNCIGIGSDAADTNLQIFTNDGTGTATKIDLGANFPANRTAGAKMTTMYSVIFYNAPASTSVLYRVVNNETGAVAEGTITTDLPATTQGLNFFASRSLGTATTGTGEFHLGKVGVYSLL